MTSENQEFRKAKNDYKNTGRIAECFYHNKETCGNKIVQAHSVQRNKRLTLIEEEVKGQNMLYTFTEWDEDFTTLKPIGKKVASTFYGFCDYHDTYLFNKIENNAFDNSNEQCFLYSYRSFAHSYHMKKEGLKAYNSDSRFTKTVSEYSRVRFNHNKIGILMAMDELDNEKKKLDKIIEEKTYDGLDYLTIVLPYKCHIACASIINPEYSYKNKPLNNDAFQTFSMVMLTVLPEENATIIILACFEDDEKGKILLNELNDIQFDLQLEKAISSLIINNAENTFFSPSLWNKLGKKGQKQLCLELKTMAEIVPNSFVHSKINFFDRQFSKTSR